MARPPFQPNEELRVKVKRLAAVGTPHEHIALMIGIRSPKTLRKYFHDELELGVAEANASVAAALYSNAVDRRETKAQELWLRCRAGWRDRDPFKTHAQEPVPFIVARDFGEFPNDAQTQGETTLDGDDNPVEFVEEPQ